jgi:hypothetical protein
MFMFGLLKPMIFRYAIRATVLILARKALPQFPADKCRFRIDA